MRNDWKEKDGIAYPVAKNKPDGSGSRKLGVRR
jgi:hypothetical protein